MRMVARFSIWVIPSGNSSAACAAQMRHFRTLMESRRPHFSRVPDQNILASPPGDGDGHIRATRDAGGAYVMIYTPLGAPVTVHTNLAVAGETVVAAWFDPRTGETQSAGRVISGGEREFLPPTAGRGEDWVLLLEGVGAAVNRA